MLTHEQKNIFDTIISAIDRHTNSPKKVFFIDGPAGRGKTFLVQTILKYLRGQEIIIIIVDTTALSILSYPRGRTAHSAFGIPVTEVYIYLQIFIK